MTYLNYFTLMLYIMLGKTYGNYASIPIYTTHPLNYFLLCVLLGNIYENCVAIPIYTAHLITLVTQIWLLE